MCVCVCVCERERENNQSDDKITQYSKSQFTLRGKIELQIYTGGETIEVTICTAVWNSEC